MGCLRLSPALARRRLTSLQRHARSTFRSLALLLHPDRTGGDKKKTAEFVRLREVLGHLQALRIVIERREPPLVGVSIGVEIVAVSHTDTLDSPDPHTSQ